MSETYLGGRIELLQGDLTKLRVEGIVTPANRTLLGGAGLDAAVHRAAGPKLLDACRKLGGASPGEAKLTLGFNLSARVIIHAVGPIWRGGREGEAELRLRASNPRDGQRPDEADREGRGEAHTPSLAEPVHRRRESARGGSPRSAVHELRGPRLEERAQVLARVLGL